MAKEVIMINVRTSNRLFYLQRELKKTYLAFESLFQDANEDTLRILDQLSILACMKKFGVRSHQNLKYEYMDMTHRLFITMQNDNCVFDAYMDQWDGMSASQKKIKYYEFIENVVKYNNINIERKILEEYPDLTSSFTMHPKISPEMLHEVLIAHSGSKTRWNGMRDWYAFHVARLRLEADGEIDPYWFPTRKLLQPYKNMNDPKLEAHDWINCPRSDPEIQQEVEEILKPPIYSNTQEPVADQKSHSQVVDKLLEQLEPMDRDDDSNSESDIELELEELEQFRPKKLTTRVPSWPSSAPSRPADKPNAPLFKQPSTPIKRYSSPPPPSGSEDDLSSDSDISFDIEPRLTSKSSIQGTEYRYLPPLQRVRGSSENVETARPKQQSIQRPKQQLTQKPKYHYPPPPQRGERNVIPVVQYPPPPAPLYRYPSPRGSECKTSPFGAIIHGAERQL